MENKKSSNLERKAKLFALSILTLGGSLIYQGYKPNEIREKILPYQGHTYDEDGKKILVFDKNPRELREDTPLIICGNDSGLSIGETYVIKYFVPKWEKVFPKKLKSFERYNSLSSTK